MLVQASAWTIDNIDYYKNDKGHKRDACASGGMIICNYHQVGISSPLSLLAVFKIALMRSI
jgi:hypothetical protein